MVNFLPNGASLGAFILVVLLLTAAIAKCAWNKTRLPPHIKKRAQQIAANRAKYRQEHAPRGDAPSVSPLDQLAELESLPVVDERNPMTHAVPHSGAAKAYAAQSEAIGASPYAGYAAPAPAPASAEAAAGSASLSTAQDDHVQLVAAGTSSQRPAGLAPTSHLSPALSSSATPASSYASATPGTPVRKYIGTDLNQAGAAPASVRGPREPLGFTTQGIRDM